MITSFSEACGSRSRVLWKTEMFRGTDAEPERVTSPSSPPSLIFAKPDSRHTPNLNRTMLAEGRCIEGV